MGLGKVVRLGEIGLVEFGHFCVKLVRGHAVS